MAVAQKVIRTKIPARMDRLPWSGWHWFIVLALGTVWVLDGLEVTIKGSLGPALKQELGFSTTQVAAGASFYLIGAVTGALFWGYLTDRFGRKKLFMITLSVYMVGVLSTTFTGLWFGQTTWYYWFAGARFITGFGVGGEYSAINSAIDELIPARVRGWVDLLINGSWWIGTAFAASAAYLYLTFLPTGVGWRVGFGMGFVIGFGLLLMRIYVPESPRWLITHGYEDEADRVVEGIEQKVLESSEIESLEEPDDDESMELRERRSVGFVEVAKTLFAIYPRRSTVAFSLLVTQAFLYNAIFFTYGLMLTTYFGVSSHVVPLFLIPFAAGNYAGPALLGPLFDRLGRRVMIPTTFLLSGVFTIAIGYLFTQHMEGGTTGMTIAWVIIFFFASAGASSGYLTASETFPLEIRAMAIAFFYACGTAIGGVSGPYIFGNFISSGSRWQLFYGYIIGGVIMIVGGLIHMAMGIEAAQQSLEDVAKPLSVEEAEGEEKSELELSGPGGVDPTDPSAIRQFQREHDLAVDGTIGPETAAALKAVDEEQDEAPAGMGSEPLTLVDITDLDEVKSFQRAYGLGEFGVVGPETMGAIRAAQRRATFDPADPDSIRAFQREHGLKEDGTVGPRTQGALRAVRTERSHEEQQAAEPYMDLDPLDGESVRRFQRECGLPDDGLIGPRTRGAILVERARRARNAEVDPADPESVRRFQARAGVRETGFVDGATQQALREERKRFDPSQRDSGLFSVDITDGESVRAFQREHQIEPDGLIGPETRRALWLEHIRNLGIDPTSPDSIRAFQREHGLDVDGAIGPETQGTMRALRSDLDPGRIDEQEEVDEPLDELDERRRVGLVDFDPADADCVRSFQRDRGLEPDGVVGPATQGALRALLVERRREQLDDDRAPKRLVKHGGHSRLGMSGGLLLLPNLPQQDDEIDREVRELLGALERRGPLSKNELRNEVRARRWGPGRFRYALKAAEREGLVRRTGRDRYAPAREQAVA